MVPVIWAFFSADVNAGTARAARIAIIAITTSNSISVNAEKGLLSLIFIVGFFSCGCSEGLVSEGFGWVIPPWHKASADECSGVLGFRLLFRLVLRGLVLRMVALI